MHRPDTCLTALKSHKSRAPLIHHLTPFYFAVSRPGATDLPSQAPGLGSFNANFTPAQVNVRNCLVDLQCFGKGLWTKTMSNHLKHENLQSDLRHTALSTTTQLKSTNSWSKDCEKYQEIKVNFTEKMQLLPLTCRVYLYHYLSSIEMSQKSRTPLVHHLAPFYFTISKPGATDPRPKHHALAPSLPMLLHSKFTFVRVWLTVNASARACGQKLCQTMSNMRTYKAICDIQPCPLPHIWNQQTAEAKIAKNMKKSRWTSAEKMQLLPLTRYIYHCLSSFENAPPIPLPSCFHPMFPCEGLLERSTGITPEHQSTNTTKVSQVSNILVQHFTPFSFTVSRPGAADPHPKHQALAPSLPMILSLK